ncbi:hypothetical protein F2P81_008249 [Scophthalmus maximus]|uniref:Uncharacterized protein n=1 Tax=Scophthalmus maximus TaxID=52904 RepID=A0A6A4TA31_SCOMX|nr:hypothetical protein F2P81_008249 [Scophthalmus maximus]
MDFFNCPCLLSDSTDQIKAVASPPNPARHQYSTEQMQNTAGLLHRFLRSVKYDSVFKKIRQNHLQDERNRSNVQSELKIR